MKNFFLATMLCIVSTFIVAQEAGHLEYTLNTWTGSVNHDWFNGGNWSLGAYIGGADVNIPSATNNSPVIQGGNAIAGSLTIASDNKLEIMDSGSLYLLGALVCDGSLIMYRNELLMTGSGSVLDNGIISGAGTFTFKRYVSSDSIYPPEPGWHLISSPVNGFNSGDINDYFLNIWNEPQSTFEHIEGSSETCCPGPYIEMAPMDGWSVKRDLLYDCNDYNSGTGDTIDFSGAISDLHTGTYSFLLKYTLPGAYKGWNLIGNPYPSFIDFDVWLINWPSPVAEAYYYWDNINLQYRCYAGGIGDQYIRPGEGFFIVTEEPTIIWSSQNARIPSIPLTKRVLPKSVLIIEVIGNGYSDETAIRFLDDATKSFNKKYDAYKLFSPVKKVPSLWTRGEDNTNFAINSVQKSESIPLYFSGDDGLYTLRIKENNIGNIVLEDIATGVFVEFNELYEFVSATQDNKNRFTIHFK